jgi:hypothetical protein
MLIADKKENLVMACHITGIYDVNRNTILANDDYEIIKDWADTLTKYNLKSIVFHNNFTEETCNKYKNETLSFIKIDHNPQFNPNIYRYFIYLDFLRQYGNSVQNLFITDISDVIVLNNPFIQKLFKDNPTAIFCGDETKPLDNEWMAAHSEHLRQNITDYAAYETQFKQHTLLNCGVIGGQIKVMLPFLEQLCFIHANYNKDNKTAYTGDMGAFNYLIRTQFNQQVIHGAPVNTIFKAYENQRTDCWFKHK